MSDSSLTPGKSLETDLRLIREARGLSREDIFNRVHIRPEVLAQVEENGFGATPTLNSDIHRRSFVKHYADAVEIDAEIALAALAKSAQDAYDGSLAQMYLGEAAPERPPDASLETKAPESEAAAGAGQVSEAVDEDADFDIVPDESPVAPVEPEAETPASPDTFEAEEDQEAEHDLAAELKSLFESDLLAAAGPQPLSGSEKLETGEQAETDEPASVADEERESKKIDKPETKGVVLHRLDTSQSKTPAVTDQEPSEEETEDEADEGVTASGEDSAGVAENEGATSAEPTVEEVGEPDIAAEEEVTTELDSGQTQAGDQVVEEPTANEPPMEERSVEEPVSPYAPPVPGQPTRKEAKVEAPPASEESTGHDRPQEAPPRPITTVRKLARSETGEPQPEPHSTPLASSGPSPRTQSHIPSSTLKQSVIGPPDEDDFGDEESLFMRLRGRHWIAGIGLIGVAVVIIVFAGQAIFGGKQKGPVMSRGIRATGELPTQFSGIVRLSPTTERFVTLQIVPDSTSTTDFMYKIWTHSAGSTFAETGEGSLNAEGNQVLFDEPYGVGGLFVESGEVRLRSVRRVRFPRWEFTGRRE